MQNIISSNSGSLTMSSLEIAGLCNKRHDHVMRDIRVMLVELHGSEGLPKFGASYLNEQNKEQPCFKLPKRESLVLVAGYNVRMRAAIIDRWQELEEQANAPVLSPANLSRLQLIELAMQAEQERLVLEEKVAKIQPMADALIRIAYTDGGRCLTDSAKVLQMKPREFTAKLAQIGWIYKRAGVTNWVGYQDKVNSGYLEHKLTTVERADGSEKSYAQCLVTPKGMAKLSLLLAKPMDGGL